MARPAAGLADGAVSIRNPVRPSSATTVPKGVAIRRRCASARRLSIIVRNHRRISAARTIPSAALEDHAPLRKRLPPRLAILAAVAIVARNPLAPHAVVAPELHGAVAERRAVTVAAVSLTADLTTNQIHDLPLARWSMISIGPIFYVHQNKFVSPLFTGGAGVRAPLHLGALFHGSKHPPRR